MATLSTKLTSTTAPAVLVWVSETANLDTNKVFLVRSGLGAPWFSRICTPADMVNYPDAEPDEGGWYRTDGINITLESTEDLGHWLEANQAALDRLDEGVLALENASPVSVQHDLRRYGTGDVIGYVQVDSASIPGSAKHTVSASVTDSDLSDLVDGAYFVVSKEDPPELLRVSTVDDIVNGSFPTDTEQVTDEITVYLNDDADDKVLAFMLREIMLELANTLTLLELI